MLSLQNISASVEDKEILHDISFAFAPGTTYAILGPNGSGKSTLGNTIMGHPDFTLTEGDIFFGETSLKNLSPDERAKLGIFLSFQNPLPLPGVSVMDLFRMALVSSKKLDAMSLHKKVKAFAEELNIKDELLRRSLHEGFSGGEKKKIEVLEAALLEPTVAIFDEIDTGVDVDALKLITTFIKKHLPKETTLVYITHSHKLLSILNPSTVLVLKNGRLIKTGDHTLAEEIEKNGFEQI
ncbi:MAG: Fe-S cluster assembly ATPase SufC [Candidatus Moranbacteria bacterium]|nr:Fe-S cluster assembly ATPase SufC [Candidatus Moranbacteria bacterium]